MGHAAILVTFRSGADLARVKAAARRAGLTDRAWCRQALLRACGEPSRSDGAALSDEAMAAVEALMSLGMTEGKARARARAALSEDRSMDASAIVARAFRQENGK